MANSYTQNYFFAEPAQGDQNWNIPLNANFTEIDSILGNYAAITVPSSGSAATLSSSQYQCLTLDFSGTPANDFTYTIPVGVSNSSAGIITGGRWMIRNSTTTGKNLLISYRANTVTIPAGQFLLVVADANISPYIFIVSDSSVITYAGNPTGNVAGNAGNPAAGVPATMVWSTTLSTLYICTTSGPAATAVWTSVTANVAKTNVGNNFTIAQTITTNNSSNSVIAGQSLVSQQTVTGVPVAGEGLWAHEIQLSNSSNALKAQTVLTGAVWTNPAAGSESAYWSIATVQSGTAGQRMNVGAGVWLPGATGGDPGAGLINAAGYQVNGVNVGMSSAVTLASTSGTAINFTIPTTARRITILFNNVSTSGTSNVQVQIGPSGTPETTGYTSFADRPGLSISSTTGFVTLNNAAANARYGQMTLVNSTGTTWIESQVIGDASSNTVSTGVGAKTTASAINILRVTTVNGTDTFDLGSITVITEA